MAGRQGVDGVGSGGWGIEQESEDMVPLRLLMVFFLIPIKMRCHWIILSSRALQSDLWFETITVIRF